MEIIRTTVKKILTRSETGFLRNETGRSVSSHSLQPFCGCSFGNALCGVACYVRWNFNLTKGREWGAFLEIRENAAESYLAHYAAEKRWASKNRNEFSIFCSSSTDPFLPQEFQYGVTRSVLEAMIESPPDLLILQTHTHLVTRYMDIYERLASCCRLRFHISIETDHGTMPNLPPHASTVENRLDACKRLRSAGHSTVVTVSPLLPINDPDQFFAEISQVADAVVLDHFIIGDGSKEGTRTLKTVLPKSMAKVNPDSVRLEYRAEMAEIARRHMPGRVGISADGFAGVYM